MSTARSATFLVIFCSCSDGAAPRDATTPDIDNGMCGSMLRFTGEYIDWDSTATAFCGIRGATFQVQGSDAKVMTPPNGRFDLCVPNVPVALVDITPPTDPSGCTQSAEVYTLPVLAVANRTVIAAGGFWSGRAFGTARQAINPSKAQVFVHVNGTPREVSLAASHGTTQAMVNGTWMQGSTGPEVFFPDVDPTGGSTILSAGSAIGTGSIPLEAGKMTSVAIIVN